MANYLKLAEVARRLGISERTARRYVRAGELPSVFVGNSYRVRAEDLERYLEAAKVHPGGGSGKAQAPLPNFEVPGERRRYAEHLMQNGVSESTARGVSGLDSRPEKYWDQLAKASGLDHKSPNPTAGEDARSYTAFEALGHIAAKGWKDDLAEWEEKIPREGLLSAANFGRLVGLAMDVSFVSNVYEEIARDLGHPRGLELEEAVRLVGEARNTALDLVIRAYEPAKTRLDFQKILQENGMDTLMSRADTRA